MGSLFSELIDLLKTNQKFIDDEGELLLAAVQDHAWKIDHDLIKLLLSKKEIKAKFFDEIEGHWIFNINTFLEYISQKNFLDNSYTRFRNRIGLTIGEKYLRERGEVSLTWAYKDTVLEGGQTKEEEKRKEIFFNEILAQDEINRLLDPKALTNFTRYTAKGRQPVKGFKRDENGVVCDNLIIHGNNLLVLHSLLIGFEGKVDLIYIDPPFNTTNDSFKYNDNFNRSAWLTFMRNRLEVAKRLLSTKGTIYVQIDHNEGHYLKVLMDEIFGKEYFRNEIIWHYSGWNKKLTSSFEKRHDTILMYGKSDSQYFKSYFEKWSSKEEYVKKRKQQLLTDENGEEYVLSDAGGGKRVKRYIKDVLSQGVVVDDVWDIDKLNNSAKEAVGFQTQKVEILLERIIEASCPENGLILDFHVGSGTTAAVAHKTGRRYIGIEQMDYVKSFTIKRLNDVIKGEQEGISKLVNWKGGGEFIYCELMKYNEAFMERIQAAKNSKELLKIWQQISEDSFLNWYVNPELPDEAIKDFEAIGKEPNGFEKQKKLLAELLDKNQLYVNLSEIDDAQFKVSKEDKALNKAFYGEA